MSVLTVNAGSSSIRLDVFAAGGNGLHRVASQHGARQENAVASVVGAILARSGGETVRAVAHRVVHGGERLVQPCIVDAAVEGEIERLAALAPLHNPVALAWIRACRELLGAGIPQIAVFDTAFFADLPEVARTYALPRSLAARHGLKRYGFHGIAHQAMWRRWRTLRPDVPGGGRVISLQLGAGCSVTAIRDGRPLDTSMGFSPLEGLVMATRSGDLDPMLVTYLERHEDLTPAAMERLLDTESGLLGVSGISGDMRALLASSEPPARLAVELFCYRARKYIGAYVAVLGGVDAVLFGGGIGEHAARVRDRILGGMDWAGIMLEPARNAAAHAETRLSRDDSPAAVWVIPVDEASVLAEEALAVLDAGATRIGTQSRP
jgi:acetate kinase